MTRLRVEKEPVFAAKTETQMKPADPVVVVTKGFVDPPTMFHPVVAEPEGFATISAKDTPILDPQPVAENVKGAEGITYPGDMANAPKDGVPVWLVDEDGVQVKGHWRRTRKLEKAQWVTTEFWAVWPGTMPLGFEPTGWFRVTGI